MEILKKLISLCKAEVSITVNGHRSVYQTVQQYLEDSDVEIEPEVFGQMIKTDTVVLVQFYPNTPIGFYLIYHYDIEEAIKLAIKTIEDKK